MGARDYVCKPYESAELLARVKNLLDAHWVHRMANDQKSILQAMVETKTQELRDTRMHIVQCLGRAAEYRDEETGNHIIRMSRYCALITERLGWSEADTQLMLNASPMHDVGKIGIPDSILLKPGRFTPEEWETMKRHAEIGAKLLEGNDSSIIKMAREIALTHHEKWDGTGYPRGLKGKDIPISGRIVAVSDVFDALTSVRPYKEAWPVDQAIQYLNDNKERHFDPEVVDAFIDQLDQILLIKQQYSD